MAPASPALRSTGPSVRRAIASRPAVQFLIHPNIKASFEYQFRPSQSVVIATNPLTGLPVALNPFHTNTAGAWLDICVLAVRFKIRDVQERKNVD